MPERRTWRPRNTLFDMATRIVEAGKKVLPEPEPPSFQARFTNTNAAAITDRDIARAAERLGVTEKHIHAIRKVESGPFGSFDNKGRPIILAEPHIFSRLTGHVFDRTHPSTSSRRWNKRLYPKSFDGRWAMLERMEHLAPGIGLQSASWGLFQIMGFHWEALGYESPAWMVQAMVDSEAGHLDALVRFIEANNLKGKLRQCQKDNAQSCIPFVRAYNGPGYAANNYHVKFARALR